MSEFPAKRSEVKVPLFQIEGETLQMSHDDFKKSFFAECMPYIGQRVMLASQYPDATFVSMGLVATKSQLNRSIFELQVDREAEVCGSAIRIDKTFSSLSFDWRGNNFFAPAPTFFNLNIGGEVLLNGIRISTPIDIEKEGIHAIVFGDNIASFVQNQDIGMKETYEELSRSVTA